HQLRRAPMISGLLEVMDRAVDVSACGGPFGVPAVQIDDLGRGEKLSRARAQELREERLEAMASLRAVAHHQARLLQSGEEPAGQPPVREYIASIACSGRSRANSPRRRSTASDRVNASSAAEMSRTDPAIRHRGRPASCGVRRVASTRWVLSGSTSASSLPNE